MNIQNVSIGAIVLISVYLLWKLRETNKQVNMLEHDVQAIAQYLHSNSPENSETMHQRQPQPQQQQQQPRQNRQSISDRVVIPGGDQQLQDKPGRNDPQPMPRNGNRFESQNRDTQNDNIELMFSQNNIMGK